MSPCGTNLVALLASGTAIIIRNLNRVVKGEIAIADASVEIDLRDEIASHFPQSVYLAVGDGRIGVVTVSRYIRLASRSCGADHRSAF